jgi:hypothetical protein
VVPICRLLEWADSVATGFSVRRSVSCRRGEPHAKLWGSRTCALCPILASGMPGLVGAAMQFRSASLARIARQADRSSAHCTR